MEKEEYYIYKSTLVERLEIYKNELIEEELSRRTITKYMSDVYQWLDEMGTIIDKSNMQRYKESLDKRYLISSLNSKLISINRFLRWNGNDKLCLKVKRGQLVGSLKNVITREAYRRMLMYAWDTGRHKMYYLMKTIARTGIRIGELKYITVQAISAGQVYVSNKGKTRWVQIPQSLCIELEQYCLANNITEGIIFCGNKKGKVISEPGVLKNMKYIARQVNVPEDVVYPHSLRHLFAKTYMEELGDISELADILGHSRIETTRIYTRTTLEEKRTRLEKLSL